MTNISNDILVKRMQKFREEQKITQIQMAKHLGLSSSYISAMERGLHTPNAITLIGYATKLQVSIDELVGNSTLIQPELLSAIQKLSVEQQNQLTSIADILRKG